MSHRFYPIALHRSEWERLKRQGGALIPGTAVGDTRKEYFEALNEQSQQWINHWPDSAEGLREKQKQQRRKQRKENLQLVDAFRKSRKHDNAQEAVKRAKQIIFEDSCYGRQLISALAESNIIEEREAQIKFKKEIMQKEAEIEKSKTYGDFTTDSENAHEEMMAKRKLGAIECVKFNEELELKKKEKTAKLKAEKIEYESVDLNMMKKISEVKPKKKAEMKLLVRKGIEEYEEVRTEEKKLRQMNEDRDDALMKVYQKEQDIMRCKVDKVLKKITEEKRHGERAVKFYKVIEEINKADKKRYEDFFNTGIETFEQRNEIQEAKELEMENKKRAECYNISKENQVAAKQNKLNRKHTEPSNKCICDIQTLLIKPDAEKKPMKVRVKTPHTFDRDTPGGSGFIKKDVFQNDKYPFLKPSTKLVEALKSRTKESSGYTGTDGADKYFAQQASDALRRTKHKYFARKVVNESFVPNVQQDC